MPESRTGLSEYPNASATPLVVLYLYVHEQDEAFDYPTARSAADADHVAERYLECALVQVASLRLQEAPCDVALVTNVADRRALGPRGTELVDRIVRFGVRIMPASYLHRPGDSSPTYVSSRYVFDAILAAAADEPESRTLWMTDLDCVWVDAPKMFAAAPPIGQVGAVLIDYEPDWDTVGFGKHGRTRSSIGEIASRWGAAPDLPPWVGGELLVGSAGALRGLVAEAETLDAKLTSDGQVLPTEEQVLSLAGAIGQIQFRDLSSLARRVLTGSRHEAPPIKAPLELGLWHLPSEKGLSLRRTSDQIRRDRTKPLQKDLRDPVRLARRFNVAGTGLPRRMRDDAWIITQRLREIAKGPLRRRIGNQM